ncbi:ATP-binding protein [Massilia genomosp. 1]|uniref:AAA family ATPase n=1 Tax=Massilia genomosp. 1 TaxID=2609280 RepID=A0ABX0MXU6_9BURK|nr:ATP-binding protein [Massilia genomosp. 1]NHZ64084.1 AAA family ATPase [Massilia genomosp. 1]
MNTFALTDVDRQDLARMEERAAFLGHFNPMTMASTPAADSNMHLLVSLSECCDEVLNEGNLAWTLTPDARTAVFERLYSEERLHEAATLAKEHQVDENDLLGKWIVKLVLDEPIDLPGLALNEISQARIAKGMVSNYLEHRMPDLDMVLERKVADNALDLVRSSRLLGRDTELAALREFMLARGPSRMQSNALMLGGVGGSGKSALLAECVRRVRGTDWSGPMVAWIDFDRALFSRFDETVMMAELARQIGLSLRDSEGVHAFRVALGKMESSSSSAKKRSFRTRAYESTNAQSLWRQYVEPTLAAGRHLVLVLDTYEEMVMQGRDVLETIAKWLDSLRSEFQLHSLRVVFSGREIADLPRGSSLRFAPSLLLGDLSRVWAIELLKQHARVDGTWMNGELLVEKFGGNPLVLKIIGRHLSVSGLQAAVDLLADDYRPGTNDPLAQGVLYTRILGRLRSKDPDLKRLAHPGLVLRRVTPQLIAAVLADPCGLGPIAQARADELFVALAEQVWLVDKESSGVLIHRKDLRNLMLKLMEGDMLHKARAIHRAAAAYYSEGKDPVLDRASQHMEALYHQLFLGELPQLPSDHAARLLNWVGTDIGCAPPEARAGLKYAASLQLSEVEQGTLSADIAHSYHDERLHSAYDAGVETHTIAGSSTHQSNVTGSRVGRFQVLQAFIQGDFDLIGSVSEEVVETALASRNDHRLSGEQRDLVDSPLWFVALAAIRNGDAKKLARYICAHPLYLHADSEPWIRDVRHSIAYSRALDTVVRLLSATIALPERPPADIPGLIRTTDELRAYQLLGYEIGGSGSVAISTYLLRYMQKSFRRFASGGDGPSGFSFDHDTWALPESPDAPLTLGDIAQGVSGAGSMRLASKPATALGRKLALGIIPELYPAIRGALHQADDRRLAQMAARAQLLTGPSWPVELGEKEFAANLAHDREKWTMVLIETADRYGKLEGIVLDSLRLWDMFRGNSQLQTIVIQLERRLQR